MAEVTELVTVFKFKGDTKPLADAGDEMQKVSENSAIAGKRMDGAGESMLDMGKNAMKGFAGVASLGAALAKITKTVFDLGQQTAELKGLGIDPVAFRETEDLFSKLGGADGDAENFVKKIAEAQNQLSLGKDSPFARSLQEQFGVLINEGDKVGDVLNRLREATKKQGFSSGQISVKAGELGFSPEFSKVLLATNKQFAEATLAIKNLAQSDKELLTQSQEASQYMKDLGQSSKRLWERFSLGLTPVIESVIWVLNLIVDGWSRIFNLADKMLVPIFTAMWKMIDKYLMPAFNAVAKFLDDVFLASIEGISKAFDFFVKAFQNHVLPVVKLMVDVFFDIVDAINEAISMIPFVGDSKEFTKAPRPSFGIGKTSNSSSVNNTNNNSNTTINLDGLSTEQINEIWNKANQKRTSSASGSW